MIRSAALALVFLGVAGAAAAEGPFDGRWAIYPDACSLKPGESDLVPVSISGRNIDYYESHCTIEQLAPIGGETTDAWRVAMSCSGEGETWTRESIMAIDRGNDERRPQLIEIDAEFGAVQVWQYCGK